MIGRTIAHYEITELLGRGGMGEVYRARDTKLGRDVALKILPAEFVADQDRVTRFRREAALVAKLNHPGIVTIHSIDEANGLLFFTMEVVEGMGLDVLLGSRSLNLERFLGIAERIVAALAVAHDAGLVHRDLKPQNIVIGSDDRPKILDFGLARSFGGIGVDPKDDATEYITGDRQLVGTIPYMSPEQIESSKVDARSDLFSLGVILHEMLSGSRPFRAESDAALLSAILRDQPPDLSQLRTDIPRELAVLVRECLEKNPANRPSNAGEVQRRLRSLRSHSSSSDVGIEPPSRNSSSWIRWAIGLAALAVVAIGAVIKLRGADGDQSVSSLAILPFSAPAGEATDYLGDSLTERLINQVSQFDQLRVMARSTVFRVDASDPLAAGQQLGVDAVVTGRIRLRGDELDIGVELIRVADGTQIWGSSFARDADALIGLEQELARGIAGELRFGLSGRQQQTLAFHPTENEEAWRKYLLGRQLWHQRNPGALRRADIELREAVTLDPDFALAHAALAQLHRVSWQYYAVDIEEENRLSRLHAERALRLDPECSEAHAALATVYFEVDWDWDGAERSYLRAIELDPSNMTARQWYGEFLAARGRFHESFESFDAAFRIDPLSPVLHVAYAWSLMAGGRHDEAHALIDELLESEPDNWVGHLYRYTLIAAGPESHSRVADALAATLDFARVDGWSDAQRARARELFEQQGRGALQLAIAEVFEARSPDSPLTRWATLLAAARMGDAEKVVGLAQQAVAEHQPMVPWFGSEPSLRQFESDPRYRQILLEHGLVTGLPTL